MRDKLSAVSGQRSAKALLGLVFAAQLGASNFTCKNIIYNDTFDNMEGCTGGSAGCTENEFDYMESPWSTTASPIVLFYPGVGYQLSGNDCEAQGFCAAAQQLNDLGYNVVLVRVLGSSGAHGKVWPAEVQSGRAFLGYLVHFINTTNAGCTIHGNINDVRQISFSSGGSELMWNIVAAASTWAQNCQYCDTGWTITYSVCMSCEGDFSLIYQEGNSTAQTAVGAIFSGVGNCGSPAVPSSGSMCATTATSNSPMGTNVTQANSPLLVLTGANDPIIVQSIQTGLVNSLNTCQSVTGSCPANWSAQQVIISDGGNGAACALSLSAPIATTAGSWTGGTATVSFTAQSGNPVPAVGAQITIAGVTPSGYNGTFTVMAATDTSVSFTVANPGGNISVQGTVGGVDRSCHTQDFALGDNTYGWPFTFPAAMSFTAATGSPAYCPLVTPCFLGGQSWPLALGFITQGKSFVPAAARNAGIF